MEEPLLKKPKTFMVNFQSGDGDGYQANSNGSNFSHSSLLTKFVTEDRDAADILATAFGASRSLASNKDGGGYSDFSRLLSQINDAKNAKGAAMPRDEKVSKFSPFSSSFHSSSDAPSIIGTDQNSSYATRLGSTDLNSNARPGYAAAAIGDFRRQGVAHGTNSNAPYDNSSSNGSTDRLGSRGFSDPRSALFLDVVGRPQQLGGEIARRDVQDTIRFLEDKSRAASLLQPLFPGSAGSLPLASSSLFSSTSFTASGAAAADASGHENGSEIASNKIGLQTFVPYRLPKGATRRFLSAGGGFSHSGFSNNSLSNNGFGQSSISQSNMMAPHASLANNSAFNIANGANALLLENFPELPMDWCLRKAVTVTSREPWHVAEQVARTCSSLTEPSVIRSTHGGDGTVDFGSLSSSSSLRSERRGEAVEWTEREDEIQGMDSKLARKNYSEWFLEAIQSHRHPGSPLDTQALFALRASKVLRDTVLLDRLRAWRQSFRGLYYSFRLGSCHCFYLIQRDGRHPFIILFLHRCLPPSLSSSPPVPSSSSTSGGGEGAKYDIDPSTPGLDLEIQAVVSQSSRAMRGRMLAAGLDFCMPLAAGGERGGRGMGEGGGRGRR
eukprot:CAMPEP_0175046314 /NCGR_PEP_ID=MMETSP0052_2-20121109/4960_1 /TAXON_ID=51329 ORGANISM="Polytomella parva, Strain SAG 63-3" /NCGR_SAMPLE_ID=MMETSP0052_2 /ASSEMBLY_ACC=CAM_ASM_000194 /LENGTH=611 /DNA_ID=CAMNT_0016310043 /DNA_START=334 /DNA_END=2166 /DNA_ORIENTATION=+